jgi:hypothetical protein
MFYTPCNWLNRSFLSLTNILSAVLFAEWFFSFSCSLTQYDIAVPLTISLVTLTSQPIASCDTHLITRFLLVMSLTYRIAHYITYFFLPLIIHRLHCSLNHSLLSLDNNLSTISVAVLFVFYTCRHLICHVIHYITRFFLLSTSYPPCCSLYHSFLSVLYVLPATRFTT